MQFILGILQYWKQLVAVLIVVGAYLFGAHNTDQAWQLKWEQARSAHVEQVALIQGEYNKRQEKISTDFMDYLRNRDSRIGQLKKELENVKTKNDNSCTLLNGTIDLHDRMSVDAPQTVAGLGGSSTEGGFVFDATPSGIALSTLLATVSENYDICHREMKKLSSLQEVVRTFQKSQSEVTK